MESPSGKPGLKLILKIKKKDQELSDATLPTPVGSSLEEPMGAASPPKEDLPSHDTEDEGNQTNERVSNQLVVYDPLANGGVIAPASDPARSQHSPSVSHSKPNQQPKILPSVGAFTVQCAGCFKWRLIPTKEKYEEIREHILENPFYCETAREWRPDISCNDPEDISQDGSRLWAIDKPNIAQPPPGWQRQLRIRGEGSTKFADVYYVAPSGKRLRSMVEIQKFLLEHPEYVQDGITMSQFSFQIPRPLQDNYVRKRPARDNNRNLEPGEEKPLPLAWVGPDDCKDFQSGRTDFPKHDEKPLFDYKAPQAKKRPRKTQAEETFSGSSVNDQDRSGANEHGQSRNSICDQ